jgi:predicted LPLAT superfamily acyltransferase/glycosyltransferase involved in cell wall biosynthesis
MTPRVLICIPTYNNQLNITASVLDALENCFNNILIIDDGSDFVVEDLIKNKISDNYKLSRLIFFRFGQNLGKGAAIKEAFKIAIANNYTNLITMDGDSQHRGSDLPAMLEQIKQSPHALIIGKRKLDGENVPESSKFGRKFSNFWVKYQTDQTIEDSQSGFRCYPLFFVQNTNFFTKKYDFEIEILIRLIWKNVQIIEIPIDVFYPPKALRVTHFNKLWDNVKISILNIILVIISLLKTKKSKLSNLTSLSVGVFIGVLPFYGLQIYIAALISFLFRLNFPLLFLGGQISIPPLIPLWTYLSLKIGSVILKTSLQVNFDQSIIYQAKSFFWTWLCGSIFLGIALALTTFCMGIILSTKNKSKMQWTGKNRGGVIGNTIMIYVTKILGVRIAYFFLYFICPYFYIFAPKSVKSQNEYFKIINPKQSFMARQFAVIKTFYRLGQVLIDNHYTLANNFKHFKVHRTGSENTSQALTHQKGLILVSAHVGSWMLASKIFGLKIQTNQEDQGAQRVNVVEYNAEDGQNAQSKIASTALNYISQNEMAPIFKVNESLNKNEIVVFMADRPLTKNYELTLFLGKLAAIDMTPFKIALTKSAPICFTFGYKNDAESYNLYLTTPIYAESYKKFEKNEAALKLANQYCQAVETYLRKYPHQWFNFYPFWSTLPQINS